MATAGAAGLRPGAVCRLRTVSEAEIGVDHAVVPRDYHCGRVTGDRLYFHSASADRAPGAGRHERAADPSAYAVLAGTPRWRTMLSNFWVAEFTCDGLSYRTVEHCFQAAKIALADPTLARSFALQSGSALARGDGVAARKHRKLVLLDAQQLARWERDKHVAMQAAMRAKFSQHPALRTVLLATGDAELWHGTGRVPPQRVWDLEAIRNELREDGRMQADLVFRFEGRAVAGLVMDAVQDAYPWYEGRLIEGPALTSVRRFVERLHAAELEFDFAPYHPDEQGYEQTDLWAYVQAIAGYREQRRALAEDDGAYAWLLPWREATDVELDRYLEFLDWRRWQAIHRSGSIERGIALPPSLDLARGRYAYRPE